MMDVRGMRDFEHLSEVERDLRCRVNLEKTVIEQREASLQRQALKLARQRAFLREERKRAKRRNKQYTTDTVLIALCSLIMTSGIRKM